MLGLSKVFGKSVVAGVDIGSRQIKLVQAEAIENDRWRINHVAVCPTPLEAVRDGVIVEVDTVGAAIKALINSSGMDATAAVAAISGSSVIVRHVKLPRMTEAILRRSIRYEAARYISSSLDDSLVEFEITGPVPNEDDKMAVMLVAAPNDMIQTRVNAILAAGLEPMSIDIEAFAMQRCLIDINPDVTVAGETVALLNIGAATTDVNIVANGSFALTRNIAIAGDNFTQALRAVSRTQDWDEIEHIKHQVDMSALLQSGYASDAMALAQAVQPAMDELLREVRRSMNYYQSQLADPSNSNLPCGVNQQNSGASVSRILVTGGSSKMMGIEQYMSARLGVPIAICDHYNNPNIEVGPQAQNAEHADHPCLSLCIGLAIKDSVSKQSQLRQIAKSNNIQSKVA